MPRILKKGLAASDDAIGWIGLALVLLAAIILDKASAPHKWHAAIMWTFLAFFGVLVFDRKKRKSLLFWMFWTAFLVLHVFAMWVIFGRFLPHLVLGTLYVVPIAFIESIFLTGVFSRLARKTAPAHPERDNSRMKSAHGE
jgi:hypothetical protein